VPAGLDDAGVIALILNYVTAYQLVHRTAAMQPGQTALVTGANGGVGTVLLELLRAHRVRALGLSSREHFDLVRSLGAEPVESRTKPVDVAVREVLPGGVDVAFDGLGGMLRGFAALFIGARFAGRRGVFLRHYRALPERQAPLQGGSPQAL
jgi:NADPH:quinone reductase